MHSFIAHIFSSIVIIIIIIAGSKFDPVFLPSFLPSLPFFFFFFWLKVRSVHPICIYSLSWEIRVHVCCREGRREGRPTWQSCESRKPSLPLTICGNEPPFRHTSILTPSPARPPRSILKKC